MESIRLELLVVRGSVSMGLWLLPLDCGRESEGGRGKGREVSQGGRFSPL